MAYAVLSTQATLTVIPVSWANQIKSNFAESCEHVVTTAGDITYADGANSMARLAIGTTSYLLGVVAGVPAWMQVLNASVSNSAAITRNKLATTARARASRSSSLAVATSTSTDLTLNSEAGTGDSDDLTWHDTVTNANRFTPTLAGRVLVIAQVSWEVSTGYEKILAIQKNGTTVARITSGASATSAGGGYYQQCSVEIDVNGSTDYVGVQVWHNQGGNQNVLATDTWVSVTLL